jgi:hypothetical protein
MAAPKGNQYAKGNKGGRPTKYKPEFPELARKLCATCGFTDQQLADWFEVSQRTINEWKLKHPEFSQSLRAGKAETDDLIERATVAHITGYYVTTERRTRNGKVTVREWVKGDPHAGLKWLAARRPEIYRQQKDVKHQLGMDDAFLRFLDQMEERAKLERAEGAKLIEHKPSDVKSDVRKAEVIEVKAEPVDDFPIEVAHA